jgi:Rrf2 family protein
MLSQKARYALHALIVLAEHGCGEPLQIADIAKDARVPRKFLEQILLDLKKRGLVRSQRGRSGGYLIGKSARDISFADVIRVIDGPLALAPCVSVTAYRKCDECLDENTCAVRLAMKEVRDATSDILDNTTLASLNAQVARVGATRKKRSKAAV